MIFIYILEKTDIYVHEMIKKQQYFCHVVSTKSN